MGRLPFPRESAYRRDLAEDRMTERVGTVIVGGGIAGCAVAHYLAEEGETGILLVEADELGSGSTGGSFGGIRQQFSTALEIELSRRGLEFWRTAERVFDSPVAWHRNGYLFMTGQPDIMAKLAEAAALQRSMGLTDVHVLDPDTGLLIEREADGLLVAILLEENPPGYGHAQMLEDFADLARVRAPSLADLRIAKQVVANVDLGGDGHPYVGLVEEGLWMLAGFGGHGVMHAPPVAKLLAKTITGRPDPSLDISSLSPWRSGDAAAEWVVAAKKS